MKNVSTSLVSRVPYSISLVLKYFEISEWEKGVFLKYKWS